MGKLIHYRQPCIGCGVCQQLQPDLWRMSKKDGKAVLLQAVAKKDVFILPIHPTLEADSQKTVDACPVRIIKLVR